MAEQKEWTDEVCYCGMLMKDHTIMGSCTSPQVMDDPDDLEDGPYNCSGGDYHLPACGGTCGTAESEVPGD